MKKTYLIFLLFAIIISSYLTGCTYLGIIPYPQVVQKKKELLYRGNFDKATQSKVTGALSGNKTLLLMEKGMIQNIQGDYSASLKSFDQALSIITDYEKRAVISARTLASQLLSLPANDNAIPYRGYSYERILLNTYQTLNYLFLGNVEEARVEVRRAEIRQKEELKRHNKEVSEYQKWADKRKISLSKYPKIKETEEELKTMSASTLNSFQNSFTYYLSGIIYELYGEENDAYIDYKKTYHLNPQFSCVQKDLLRLSKKLGFQEEHSVWLESFHNHSNISYNEMDAEIIVFFGAGFISQKEQIKLPIFINKSVVTIALPFYTHDRNLKKGSNFLIECFDNGIASGGSSKVVNLDPLAKKSLQERFSIIFFRQMARILGKATLSKQLSNSSQLAFLASSLYSILSENADLRNWLLLPNNIQVFRKKITNGSHEFIWQLKTPSGKILDIIKDSVTIQKGEVCLVNLRSIEDRLFGDIKIIPRNI